MKLSKQEREQALTLHLKNYRKQLDALMDAISIDSLEKIVSVMIEAYRNHNTIFICGNGGSAATASHMQVDLGFSVRYYKKPCFRARSITDHVSMMTAVGNDTSYEEIFVQQLQDNFDEGDVLIGISASGNSMNVVRAAEYANEHGGTSIAFVGFTGGKLKEVCHHAIYTPNKKGDYGPIEDLHMILDHFLVTYFREDKEFMSIT